jgi:CRISPR-associated RAMP protein (TIGR02581 family)
MFDTFKNRLELKGVLTTVTALRISQGRSMEPIGSDLPVVKDAFDRPLIPGSSFKGAMRSRLESFLRAIDPNLAANPAIEAEWAITSDRLNGKNGIKEEVEQELQQLYPGEEQRKERIGKRDTFLTNKILSETDLASHLFGSPWLSSKLQIQDLSVLPEHWFGQYQERDGVAIDRDTETAAEGKLYDFQVVPAGTLFQFRAIVENAEEWELGLLMIGLHQFETEQIPLGGGRSRGLGVVKLSLNNHWWFDYPENDPAQLIQYLQHLIHNEKDHYRMSPERYDACKADWANALLEELRKPREQRFIKVTATSSVS